MKPRQKKSRFYYYFWGICAVAVCAGQWYVGSGYRKMSNSIDKVLSAPIIMDFGLKERMDPCIMDPLLPLPRPDIQYLDDNMA